MISLELFNNREIAAGVWLVVVLVIVILVLRPRQFFAELLKGFQSVALLVLVALACAYLTIAVYGLLKIGFWESTLLKGTILWAILSGSVLIFRSLGSSGAEFTFRSLLRDNLKVIVIIEFLVNSYTFSLIAELLLWPTLVAVAAVDALSKSHEQHRGVSKLTSSILVLFGSIVIVQAGWRAIGDWESLATTLTLREFFLAPVLSMSLVPFIYLSQVFGCYDSIFRRLSLSLELQKDSGLKRYAKRKILRTCGLDTAKLRQLLCDRNKVRLMQIRSKEDVDSLLEFTAQEAIH